MYKIQSSWNLERVNSDLKLYSFWLSKSYLMATKFAENYELFFKEIKVNNYNSQKNSDYSKQFNLKKSQIEIFISQLKNKEIIIPIKSNELSSTEARYHRQELFFENFENKNESGGQINYKLQEKKVLIAGLGGYGTWTALLCARIGIKNITLIDPDIIELSNLNRQVLYFDSDIGEKKVTICKREIEKIDASISVKALDVSIDKLSDFSEYVDGIDLIFNSFGYLPINSEVSTLSQRLNEFCIEKAIPCLNFNGSWIGPIVDSNYPDSYFTLIENPEISEILKKFEPKETDKYLSAFAPRISITCAIAVWEAVKYLTKIYGSSFLQKNVIVLDTINYTNHQIISIFDK